MSSRRRGAAAKREGADDLVTFLQRGTLSAVGTSGSRITFTSYQDDTVGGNLRSRTHAQPIADMHVGKRNAFLRAVR